MAAVRCARWHGISLCCVLGLLLAGNVYAAASVNTGAMHTDELRHFMRRAAIDAGVAAQPVTVIVESDMDSYEQGEITAAAGKLRYSIGRRHEVVLPAGRLQQFIARLPAASLVRFPYPHQPLAMTGQGVVLTGAGDMQAFGKNGTGVKVGVIDLGFASLASAQASGDLPASLSVVDYTGTGTGGTDHGTNVAQIVYEMAPGAQFYLAKVDSDVQLQQAVNDMVAAGVRVVNHSVGWYGAAFYDGTGPLCDTANQADLSNIQWVNAMGNDRNRHYLGVFNDANADLRHEFVAGQNYNTVNLTAGAALSLILNWEAYPSTNVDYNLYLYSGNPDAGGAVVAKSESRQGAGYPYPYEALTYAPATTGTYYIVVRKLKSTTPNLRLTLFSLGSDLSVKTLASSLAQPADCARVVSVGATDLSDVAEYFSSEGPTTDGRAKPEVSGPDRVRTSLTSLFAGTSAASPHVTGGVVLLRGVYPSMTTAQIRTLLTGAVKDVNIAGYDYRTGYGRISLDADADGVNHDSDNCPLVSNTNQLDLDGDKIGDVCDLDIDGDGLLNTQETVLGTNPRQADTDGDGLSDGAEVNTFGTNPLLADTDGDGLTDGEEVNIYKTNPKVSDKGDLAPRGAPDKTVNLADLLMLMRFIEDLDTPTSRDTHLGDMNSDNVLDIRDVLILRKKLGF
jgi:hypothetical protein